MTSLLAACTVATAGLAGSAAAQSVAAGETEARERFEHGTALIEEGRFSEARSELDAALALTSRPPIAFNLVVAERGMGAFVDASRTCADLLGERHGTLDETRRVAAEELCAEVDANVAHLELTLTSDVAAEVRLDGVSLGTLSPDETLPLAVDPGEHTLAITAAGREPLHRDMSLEPGEHVTLDLALSGPVTAAETGGDDTALIVGLSVGGGALVVGGIVLAIVLATLPSPSPPAGDLPITETLVASGGLAGSLVRW